MTFNFAYTRCFAIDVSQNKILKDRNVSHTHKNIKRCEFSENNFKKKDNLI